MKVKLRYCDNLKTQARICTSGSAEPLLGENTAMKLNWRASLAKLGLGVPGEDRRI
jgi:hypothetical protein